MRVRRGSSATVQKRPVRASASCTMERNLIMWKRLPSCPTRSWTWNTGPGESSLTSRATASIRGEVTTSTTTEKSEVEGRA